ncbi:CHRD domain-containing protein [Phenylobacterium sp. LjRoot219]|uniref:CHRD domain-containing protein n=1 Tax=Phenylobacterium sp. LjRoot219 TaxID=3342283 RepID=UPI003ECE36DB
MTNISLRAVSIGSLAAIGLAVSALPTFAQEGGRPLKASLTGAAEKPTAGDPDGAGVAALQVNVGKTQICYDLQVSDVAVATMAHIHKAPATDAGPVVVPLTAPSVDGKSSACVTVAQDLAKDILQNPDAYYVNVHNAEFPAGAVRGQLSK